AQQTGISDFALFGGNGSCPGGSGQKTPSSPGCGAIIGSGSKLLGGAVGSYSFIQANNNVSINGSVYSGGTISFSSNDTVSGRITAANCFKKTGWILQAGLN